MHCDALIVNELVRFQIEDEMWIENGRLDECSFIKESIVDCYNDLIIIIYSSSPVT